MGAVMSLHCLISVVLLSGWSVFYTQPPDRIVLVGDSISLGSGWVPRVRASGVVQITNLSERGSSAQSWALEPVIPPSFYKAPRTWGMIALGVNDAYRRRTVLDFYFDLATISDGMLAAGADRVILLLMPAESGRPRTHYVRNQFNALQAVMCKWLRAFVCIDASDMPFRYFNNFNVHPSWYGQRWLAVRIESTIRGWSQRRLLGIGN